MDDSIIVWPEKLNKKKTFSLDIMILGSVIKDFDEIENYRGARFFLGMGWELSFY